MNTSDTSSTDPAEPMRLLRIYLRDHDAASMAGEALARRCAGSNDNDLGEYLRVQFLPQIQAEQPTLRVALEAIESGPSTVKRVLARSGELVGRAKANGHLTAYSPSSRVVEIEGLIAGVHAKHRMWATVDMLRRQYAVTALPDVAVHLAAAKDQMARLERHHEQAVRAAFTAGGLESPSHG